MEINLFGPLEVRDSGELRVLKRRQQRSLLAVLALHAGEVVSTDRLIEDLWGASPPRSALGSLQNTVSALRGALGPDLVVTQPPGYRLGLPREAVDVHRFEDLVRSARGVEPAERATLLRQALGLWRGEPLADLAFEPFADAEIARLEELRVGAIEDRVEADLALGHHAELVAELEALVTGHPLRERLRGQLMVALYRCGRQAEALEVYRAARLALADELGLDPSPELQELERKVLRQDPELAAPAFVAGAPVPPPVERRLVTVLAGVPAAEEEPEALRRSLDALLERTQAALARHGGELERFGPEGFVATFGAEAPRDDDALRAVRAAIELDLSAGVATGEVVAGAGAVVTRAARLARAEGLRLDARTLDLVRDAVAVEEDGDAFRVLELDPTAEGWARRLDAPLVGRDGELARLDAAFASSREERGCRALTVVGEPGIGKTRLARELALRLGGQAEVLVARCLPQGEGATFLPLLAALRHADMARTLSDDPDAALVLARLAALAEGSDGASLGESYWAVRRLLEALGRTRPVLLALDDVHWAEPALLDLVDYLADRAEAPVLVLCLARPELERPLGETLRLGPLDAEDTRAVVTGTAELPEDTQERIVRLAEGNALYAEQLAVFAAEGGEGLPPTLEAVLASRLGRIEPAERAVLQRAAVVGREFSRDAVAALAEDDVVRHLLALSRRGLVHPAPGAGPGDDAYTFHHVLLRDAAYESLTKADRADLHERCAAWLDRNGPGDDVIAGYHLEQAALLRRELGEDAEALAVAAGQRLGEAGMRVWRTNDVSAATTLLARATQLLPRGRRRGELLWELSLALRAHGGPADAVTRMAEARAEADELRDAALGARVAAETARLRLAAGEISLESATVALSKAVETLRSAGDERGLGRALLALSGVHTFGCNMSEWEVAAAEAAVHYVRAGFSPASCIGGQAEAVYHGPVPVSEAKSRCRALIESARDPMTEANVAAVLGALHALDGEATEGRLLVDRARGLFDDLGNRLGAVMALAPLRIDVEVFGGDLEEAERIARASFDALTAGGAASRAYSSSRAVQLADLLLDRGRTEDAKAFIDYASEHAVPFDVYVQFMRRSTAARYLVRAGDPEGAEALAREAVAISSLTDALRDRARTHAALAEVLVIAGRGTEAPAERDEARRLLELKEARALLTRPEAATTPA